MGKQMVWLAIPQLYSRLKRTGTGNIKTKIHIRSHDHCQPITTLLPHTSSAIFNV